MKRIKSQVATTAVLVIMVTKMIVFRGKEEKEEEIEDGQKKNAIQLFEVWHFTEMITPSFLLLSPLGQQMLSGNIFEPIR